MHKPLVLAAMALLGSATLAAAQPSPPAPPPPASDAPPQQQGEGMHERMRGPDMMREAHMRGMMGQDGPRAARFRFEKEGARVSIACANNETTRACVDAAGVLIDKLAAQPTR